MTGELMTAKTIFRNEDGHLCRHLRYTYTYDSENRVTSKEAFKWDSVKEAWVQMCIRDSCWTMPLNIPMKR